MANPQRENGYTAIANEILEALVKTRINGETRQVIDFVIRKTYGYNKTQDQIALSQFALATGMKKPEVCRALNKATGMNILKLVGKKANAIGNTYKLNKDFDSWKPLAKKPQGLAKKQISVGKNANQPLAKMPHTKDIYTKDTITKDISKVNFAGKDINSLLKEFEKVNPAQTFYNNTTQRKALERLVSKFGLDKVRGAIEILPETNEQQYAPVITSPVMLEKNLARLVAHVKRSRSKKSNTSRFSI